MDTPPNASPGYRCDRSHATAASPAPNRQASPGRRTTAVDLRATRQSAEFAAARPAGLATAMAASRACARDCRAQASRYLLHRHLNAVRPGSSRALTPPKHHSQRPRTDRAAPPPIRKMRAWGLLSGKGQTPDAGKGDQRHTLMLSIAFASKAK